LKYYIFKKEKNLLLLKRKHEEKVVKNSSVGIFKNRKKLNKKNSSFQNVYFFIFFKTLSNCVGLYEIGFLNHLQQCSICDLAN
jgi:hypothetical protein